MSTILQHIPEFLLALSTLIGGIFSFFTNRKANKAKKEIAQYEAKASFIKRQQEELENSYQKIIKITQAQVQLINKLSDVSIERDNSKAEVERLKIEVESLKKELEELKGKYEALLRKQNSDLK